jgi:AcrR family transcriptional regulator
MRIVKEHQVRRSEILGAAQQLFYLKGYEPTSIQDIITEIGIAKGTFYHYFSSKQALLDAIIERIIEQTLQMVEPTVADERLSAVEKIEKFFGDIANWKIENKAFLLDLLNIWYKDDNALLRDKAKVASIKNTIPVLAKIIEQGTAEGVFAAECPADMAEIILQIAQGLSEALAKIILERDPEVDCLALIEGKITAYQGAIERVLKAPPGSIRLVTLEQVKPWLA